MIYLILVLQPFYSSESIYICDLYEELKKRAYFVDFVHRGRCLRMILRIETVQDHIGD